MAQVQEQDQAQALDPPFAIAAQPLARLADLP
jgi:hypothetical protein